jgi:A/G-specific adenine glycosylase
MTPPRIAADLLRWYDQHAAAFPWRARPNTPAPPAYHVWLSEMMLQQTQVETVRPYFQRFISTYPTLQDLAAASLDDVLKLWEGLGYYSRARNLHRAAQQIVTTFDGRVPNTVDALLTLAGVGRYTAGAIASIAYGVRAPLLDGNVMRVFTRLLDIADDVTQPATQERLWTQAAAWLPSQRVGDYNQALMELGRVICKPRGPQCGSCPLRAQCLAYKNGTQSERPVKPSKAPTPSVSAACALIRDADGRLLIAQRPPRGLLGGLWMFPSGPYPANDPSPAALAQALRDLLGIEIVVNDEFVVVKHAFTHFKLTLHAYNARLHSNPPQALGVAAWAWAHEDELARYSFGKADHHIIAALATRRGMLF